jgi:hypothetical protein
LLGETVIAFELRFGNQSTDSTDTRNRRLLMAETKIEKLVASLEAPSTTAAADAAGADTVPIVIPSAAADRGLSDEDLERVSGGAGESESVRPQVRRLLESSHS